MDIQKYFSVKRKSGENVSADEDHQKKRTRSEDPQQRADDCGNKPYSDGRDQNEGEWLLEYTEKVGLHQPNDESNELEDEDLLGDVVNSHTDVFTAQTPSSVANKPGPDDLSASAADGPMQPKTCVFKIKNGRRFNPSWYKTQ